MKKNIFIVIIVFLALALGLCLYLLLNNNKITVSFNTNSELQLTGIEIKKDDSINLPTVEREGYTFLGWYIGDTKVDNNYKYSNNTILSAKWEKNITTAKTHKVTFVIPCCIDEKDCNCASKSIEVEVEDGNKVEKPTDPTENGLKFKEWQLDGKTYDFNNPVTSDITLKAIWESASNNSSSNYYTITLKDEHGVSTIQTSSLKVACNTAITNLPKLTSSSGDYIFAGWFDDNDKQYKNGDMMPCKDITLLASWGRSMYPDGVKKPLIYIYPEKEMDVEIKLGNPNLLTTVYPEYNNVWKVKAYPSGKLIDKNTGRELYGLYWEGKDMGHKVTNEGFVVKGDDTASFLEEKLAILGLNEREAEEFIIYWLPQMEHNNYNYIRFATKDEIDNYMPLSINPKPDTVIRIIMEFMPLEDKISVQEQKLEKKDRVGYTVVEWGGSHIYQDSNIVR